MKTAYDFSAQNLQGKEVNLSEYKGKFMLIVNVASKCGFTPQYTGLEDLFKSMHKDLVVLGFPCNQFGAQEPGAAAEIESFCQVNYGVSFPMFSKIDVNGSEAHPLYQFLKGEKPGLLGTEAIKWNFTKFLVNREGQVIKRYAPTDTPEKIKSDIQKLI
jgi:glutathione peroxidase